MLVRFAAFPRQQAVVVVDFVAVAVDQTAVAAAAALNTLAAFAQST